MKKILYERDLINLSQDKQNLICLIIDNEKNKLLNIGQDLNKVYNNLLNQLINTNKIGNTVLKNDMKLYAINRIKWKLLFYSN